MSTATRYPARCHEFARRLYEDGRTIDEILALLARYGHHPAKSTVVYWCKPEAKRRHALKQRQRLYPAKRQPRGAIWWAKYRRMRELREAGLSHASIAKVIRLDYGDELTGEQIRHLLDRGGPNSAKRVLSRAAA